MCTTLSVVDVLVSVICNIFLCSNVFTFYCNDNAYTHLSTFLICFNVCRFKATCLVLLMMAG